jgi:hypothetical protein
MPKTPPRLLYRTHSQIQSSELGRIGTEQTHLAQGNLCCVLLAMCVANVGGEVPQRQKHFARDRSTIGLASFGATHHAALPVPLFQGRCRHAVFAVFLHASNFRHTKPWFRNLGWSEEV